MIRMGGEAELRAPPLPCPPTRSELELVDVCPRECERRYADDHAVSPHRAPTGLPSAVRLPGPAGDVALDDGVRGVHRDVAEVDHVPESDLANASGLHVAPHLARKPETRQPDVALPLLRQHPSGSRDSDRRRRDDP